MAATPRLVPLGAPPELLAGETLLMHANAWLQRGAGRPGTLFCTNYRLHWADARDFGGADCVPEAPAASSAGPATAQSSWASSAGQQQAGPVSVPYAALDAAAWRSRGGGRRCVKLTTKHFLLLKLAFLPDDGAVDRVAAAIAHFAWYGSAVDRCFALLSSSSSSSSQQQPDSGWRTYDVRAEFARIGVPDATWRLSEANGSYGLCESYPHLVAVPASFSDEQLRDEAAFRTSGRFPALCWRDAATKAVILRSSQPRVGIGNRRCDADVQLLELVRVSGGKPKALLAIYDARPRVNAAVNRAMKGAGAEDVSKYSKCSLHFMSIENIHVMRESKRKLRKLVFGVRLGRASLTSDAVDATGWLHHIQQILAAATRIAAQVASGVSCLVHCSDGWDRTPQLCALAELCLDPFYRTIDGFAVLLEKEWLSFGHKFSHRYGYGRPEYSECSPVFLQFLDCIFQISLQFPGSFEFNEEFLIAIADELYFCRCGTFLGNTERERRDMHLQGKTVSLWSLLKPNRALYLNPIFNPAANTGAIHPKADSRYVRLWKGYYCRWGIVAADQIGWGAKLSSHAQYNEFMEAIQREEAAKRAAAAATDEESGVPGKEPKAIVTVAHDAQDETQITLRIGQEVFVIDQTDTKFWFVSVDRQRSVFGYYPRTHLKLLIDRPAVKAAAATSSAAWVVAGPKSGGRNAGKSSATPSDAGQHRTQRSYLGSLLARLGQSREALQGVTQQEMPALTPVHAVSHRAIPRQQAPQKPLPSPSPRDLLQQKQQQAVRSRVAGSREEPAPDGTVRRRSMSSALMPDEFVARMAREMLASHASKGVDDALSRKRTRPVVMSWKEAKRVWGRKPPNPKLRRKRVRPGRAGKAPWPIRSVWRRHGVSGSRRQTDPGRPDGGRPLMLRALVRSIDSMPSKPSRTAPIPSPPPSPTPSAATAPQPQPQPLSTAKKSRSMAELPIPQLSSPSPVSLRLEDEPATPLFTAAVDLDDTLPPAPTSQPPTPNGPRSPRPLVAVDQALRSRSPPTQPPPAIPPQHRPAASLANPKLVRMIATSYAGSAPPLPVTPSQLQQTQLRRAPQPPARAATTPVKTPTTPSPPLASPRKPPSTPPARPQPQPTSPRPLQPLSRPSHTPSKSLSAMQAAGPQPQQPPLKPLPLPHARPAPSSPSYTTPTTSTPVANARPPKPAAEAGTSV